MGTKSFLGEFEQMLLLAILRKGDEAYGVEVRRELEECTGKSVTRGAFYTTLDRLQSKGYLTWEKKPVEGRRGGRPQRHFEVTEEGLEELRRVREAFDNLWEGLDHVVARSR
ncbi:MAG: PadR family transcriptional regulator [Acidobacteriota bacterium]